MDKYGFIHGDLVPNRSHFGYKGDHYGSVRVSGVDWGSIGLIREQCGLIGFIGD